MKILILSSLLFSISAFANPFDSFVGKYKVEGPVNVKNYNAKACIRYGLPNITGIEVKTDTNGYKQSHLIYLISSTGWSGLPVMQYEDRSDFDSTIFYARISGGSSTASNTWGSTAMEHYEDKFSFERAGSSLTFNFSEEYVVNGKINAGCYYQVQLK
jgi:hypothetical protein